MRLAIVPATIENSTGYFSETARRRLVRSEPEDRLDTSARADRACLREAGSAAGPRA